MSNSEKVEYILSIKDLASGSLKTIALDARGAGAAMDSMSNKTGTLGGGLGKLALSAGIAAIAFKGFQFLKDSVSKFNEAEQASAQLDATLKSTAGAIGLTREALDQQATAMSKVTMYDDDAIAGMQSLLGTFTDIKGAVFQELTPAIADVASKMGQDLAGTAIQLGKALNAPADGLAKLTKIGVTFSEQQKAQVKAMVAAGDTAGAQRIIIAELNKEFGGSAEAAAKAGTGGLTVLANRFGNIQESMGGLIVHGFEKLYPLLSKVMDIIEAAPEFMKKYSTEIETAGVFIGILALGVGIYTLAVNAAAIGTAIWTGAQWLLNAALTANPIGLVVAGIAALAAGIYYAWNKSETFRSTLYGIWEVAKVLVDTFITLGKALIFPSPENITNAISSLSSLGDNVSGAYQKGKDKGAASFAEEKKEEASKKKISSLAPSMSLAASAAGGGSAKTSSMAAASKPTVINVTIDSLVKNMTIAKEGFKESTMQMKADVSKMLIGAVNDFQRVAE